jgi:hypothetical protein
MTSPRCPPPLSSSRHLASAIVSFTRARVSVPTQTRRRTRMMRIGWLLSRVGTIVFVVSAVAAIPLGYDAMLAVVIASVVITLIGLQLRRAARHLRP